MHANTHAWQYRAITKTRRESGRALPGIIGTIISWILNRAADVVGWVWQNLWALNIGIGGLLHMYIVIKK